MQGWNILSGKKEGLLHGIYKFELLFKGNLIEILAGEERSSILNNRNKRTGPAHGKVRYFRIFFS